MHPQPELPTPLELDDISQWGELGNQITDLLIDQRNPVMVCIQPRTEHERVGFHLIIWVQREIQVQDATLRVHVEIEQEIDIESQRCGWVMTFYPVSADLLNR